MGVFRRAWRPALIAVAALAAYSPAIRGALLWNDTDYVTQAPLRSWHGLKLIWMQPGATEQYYPWLHSAFWIEHRLWGDAALGYHLVNLLWHVVAACLLAAVLRRLAAPGAWLAAGIFALHPVGVESVAWISEQKNTLSLVFYLGAALAYLRFDESLPRRMAPYLLATTLFVLALLTKTVTATLPAALIVAIWWRRGRLQWRRDFAPLSPWLALGATAGLFSAWVERRYVGAAGPEFALTMGQRFLVAGRAVWFYLGKLLWPEHLVFIYPRWVVDPRQLAQYAYPLGAAAVAAAFWFIRRRFRGPLAVWLFFIGSLFPVLGFFNVYAFVFSFVADHFQYLASLGIIAGGAALLTLGWERLAPRAHGAGKALAFAFLGILGVLSWRQCRAYRDLPGFYDAILERNPACWMAHNNLGNVLRGLGRGAEAMDHYEQALRLRPGYPEAHVNLGLALADAGRLEEAAAQQEAALRARPAYPVARNNLGNVLVRLRRYDEAIAQFQAALRIDPDYADAHFDLADALVRTGRLPEAIAHFGAAVRLSPDWLEARFNLANACLRSGRDAEALVQFREALRLWPDYVEARNGLGDALFDLGRFGEAKDEFARVVRLRPRYAEAHNNLGNALARLGQSPEAIDEFREALRLRPDYVDVDNNLAVALDQTGRVGEAAELFARVLRLRPDYAEAHNNFGNVLVQLGRIDEARAQYEEALRLRPNYPEARDNLARLPRG